MLGRNRAKQSVIQQKGWRAIRTGATASALADRAISRESFVLVNRLTFRGGTFFPLHPDGPHV